MSRVEHPPPHLSAHSARQAYELSTLTGTQVLLLVASETGHVYTFATPKLQPLITKSEGKNLIQACLNAPDNTPASSGGAPSRISGNQSQQEQNLGSYADAGGLSEQYDDEKAPPHAPKADAKSFTPLGVAAQMNPQFATPPAAYGDYAGAAGLAGYPGMMQRAGYPMPAGYGPGAGPAAAYAQQYPYGMAGWPKGAPSGAMGMPLPQGGHPGQAPGGQPMGQHGKQ